MDSIILVARNTEGEAAEFRLYEREKQYTIGSRADISLGLLEPNLSSKRKGMYPIAAFITYIDGAWYFRSAKGHRRGKKMVKVNGTPIDASHPEVKIERGHVLSFGEDDDVVVQVFGEVKKETLKDQVPNLAGLFDEVKMEFESLNEEIRQRFGLDARANTGIIMSRLESVGLFNAAYEYNLARGLRNIVAHPSPGIVSTIKRQYVYDALRAIKSVRQSLQALEAKSGA